MSRWLLAFFFFAQMANAKIRMAITVDDLPAHSVVPENSDRLSIATQMIAALKKHKVPSVYGFINAEKLQENPAHLEVLKVWTQAKFPLGNHTYSHQSLNKVPLEVFKDEIEKNEPALSNYGASFDWKYFRYPFLHEGDTIEKRDGIREFLKNKGYKIAQVTVDFEDWAWQEPYAKCVQQKSDSDIQWLKQSYVANALENLNRAELISKHLFKRSIPQILLLHIGAFTAVELDELLTSFEKVGVQFISLSEAVKDKVYSLEPGRTFPWGAEFTYQVLRSRGLKFKEIQPEPFAGYPEAKLKELCATSK